MDPFMQAALVEAKAGLAGGNLPVGSVVVKNGEVIGVGRNRQSESGDPTTHAELEAIRDAVRRAGSPDAPGLFEGATCFTTMMPCPMCAGAIIRFGLAKVVVAETTSYVDSGTQPLMERQGIPVEVGQEQTIIDLVESYLADNPETARAMKSKARPQLRF